MIAVGVDDTDGTLHDVLVQLNPGPIVEKRMVLLGEDFVLTEFEEGLYTVPCLGVQVCCVDRVELTRGCSRVSIRQDGLREYVIMVHCLGERKVLRLRNQNVLNTRREVEFIERFAK